MSQPIIGVFSLTSNESQINLRVFYYMDAILEAGGIPLLVPIINNTEDVEEIINRFDGFLFTGGQDINPQLYNEERKEYTISVYEDRDNVESTVMKRAINMNKPILAICRGLQLLNVVLGGSLYQDIKIEKNKDKDSYHLDKENIFGESHNVIVSKDSLLASVVNARILGVNTIHHQGISILAPSLKEAAISEDGLIEGVYAEDKRFVLGVQWHPELMYKEYEEHFNIFKSFIEATKI
jgi:putative glutamine amidotransferase